MSIYKDYKFNKDLTCLFDGKRANLEKYYNFLRICHELLRFEIICQGTRQMNGKVKGKGNQ